MSGGATLTVDVEYSQYYLTDGGGDIDALEPPSSDASHVRAAGSAAIVVSATEYGPVTLVVERCETAPQPELEQWDVVEEFTLECGDETYLGTPTMGTLDDPVLVGEGTHRVRLSAKGVAEASKYATLDDPVETHRLQVWPSSAEPPRVLKPWR